MHVEKQCSSPLREDSILGRVSELGLNIPQAQRSYGDRPWFEVSSERLQKWGIDRVPLDWQFCILSTTLQPLLTLLKEKLTRSHKSTWITCVKSDLVSY